LSATADIPQTNGGPNDEPSTVNSCLPDGATPTPAQTRTGLHRGGASIGASSVASASTATTDPPGPRAAHTDAEHTTDAIEATLAIDSSAEPTSREAEIFCAAELAAEAAVTFEDEAAMGAAVEALTAAAEPIGLTDTVGVMLATVKEGGPEFDEAYTAVIDYIKANCGYAELNVTASQYHFYGLPSELSAGTDDHQPRQRRRTSPRNRHRTDQRRRHPRSRNSPSSPKTNSTGR
jgi:hypothetical protein